MLLIYNKRSFIIVLFLFISCTSDSDFEQEILKNDPELNITETTVLSSERSVTLSNQNYGSESEQIYDIYLPEERSSATTKVFVLIHGGSWIDGDKSDMEDLIPILQNSNPEYAIVNMNYVLANETTFAFPNQFYNIEDLLDELEARSEEFQIATEFALIGRSAGGHLALMYDYGYDELDRVKMVCTIGGPTDFTNPFYLNRPNFDKLFELLVDTEAFPPNANLVRRLSPARRVNLNSSPTIIFHGKNDNIVPVANARKLKRKLKKKNIPKRLIRFDEGHSNWSEETMQVFGQKLNNFIQNHFSI